ncbi:hypothetical protein BDN70DRAFT_241972 [Pholiota conissans]|uniref:Mid2 domain-containing protein n=1 Tax=Pholiota conissans TaxID=109636 RepID=A0A9P6CX95_9AGAR|nr:hypothetical protein BDN70DRAFT_241972 [Pholiota conissans]
MFLRDWSRGRSFGGISVFSRKPRRRGIANDLDPAAFCKQFPVFCPPTKHNHTTKEPAKPTKEPEPNPPASPPVKTTPNPPPTTAMSTATQAPPPPSPPPPTSSTSSPTPTPQPTVIATLQDTSTPSAASTEANQATPSQSSAAISVSSVEESDTTRTVVSTDSSGHLTTKDVVTTVPIPFTTSSGIPLIRTTDSLGSTVTVPYGPDPTDSSLSNNSNDGTSTTTPAQINGAASKDSNVGAVVGGVLGGIALLVLLIMGFCYIRRRRRAIRTAPSSEFLNRGNYPFSGSANFLFQHAGSYGSTSVIDIVSPTREEPDPFSAHSSEKLPIIQMFDRLFVCLMR